MNKPGLITPAAEPQKTVVTIEIDPRGQTTVACNQRLLPIQLMGLYVALLSSALQGMAKEQSLIIDPNRKRPAEPPPAPTNNVS